MTTIQRPAADVAPLIAARSTCRLPAGQPDANGANWPTVPALVELHATAGASGACAQTSVRALAGERALYVRFDCAQDVSHLVPGAHPQPLSQGERVWLEICPFNHASQRWRFEADFKGQREVTRHQRVIGESSLGAVADVWQSSGAAPLARGAWHYFHGLVRGGWFAEFEIPWRSLGLTQRPPTIGLALGRTIATAPNSGGLVSVAWPAGGAGGEALIGADAGAPECMELPCPTFGDNRGRIVLGDNWPRTPRSVRTCNLLPSGRRQHVRRTSITPGDSCIEFDCHLDRGLDNHAQPLEPPLLLIEVCDEQDRPLYAAAAPFGRHLGLCVDEPFGTQARESEKLSTRRDRWLDRVTRALPLLYRATTAQGAPSDFCLLFEDGSLAVNLVADDAWQRLAAIVEERFANAEDRLVAAMTLVGQKSVTNLILAPLFLTPGGDAAYHTMLWEAMGPLSILRYGGGPAVARAAVLAMLLQHVHDPVSRRTFSTRVLSLTRDGGPRQTARRYLRDKTLSPFVQQPGMVGAVAVNYRDSQTLLDPTALALFAADEQRLATVEQILNDNSLCSDGAGVLAEVYAKLDVEEMRRHRPNRLLSRGVFPELCAEESGGDAPLDHRERQLPLALVLHEGQPAVTEAVFRETDGAPGTRRPRLVLERHAGGLRLSLNVAGVAPGKMEARDRAIERVHLLIDPAHDHTQVRHFVIGMEGERRLYQEFAGSIQRLFKHLATENSTEELEIQDQPWSAQWKDQPDGYGVVLDLPWSSLGIDAAGELPPVIGLNVWIDGRSPHYEQVFLTPPRFRLPADPFSFADVYLNNAPVTLSEIDLSVPTWGLNQARVALHNPGTEPRRVVVQSENHLSMRRRQVSLPAVEALVPPGQSVTVEVPYLADSEEKMCSSGGQVVTLLVQNDDLLIYRGQWRLTYCGPLSAYQRYGSDAGPAVDPEPGAPDYLPKKINYICSKLPQFERLTTRQGAASDFVVRARDGSVTFNLMQPGVLEQMADYVRDLFETDLDRVLGMFYLAYAPAVLRHMSFGHHIMTGADPLSVIRGNFAGGGGNCGYHSRGFAGMAARLRIGQEQLVSHTVGVWGHVIAAIGWRGSKAPLDADVGHIFLTADGRDVATIEDLRNDLAVLSTAGPGELGRYLTATDFSLNRSEIKTVNFQGTFPPGAPKC